MGAVRDVVNQTYLYLVFCSTGVFALVYIRHLEKQPLLSWLTLLFAAIGLVIGAILAYAANLVINELSRGDSTKE